MAGGKGTRFRSSRPKQFLELNGRPVILHTIEAFFRYSENINVILVLPENDIETWRQLTEKFRFQKSVIVQAGGSTRFQSVKKGLELIADNDGLVAIHDGVRPLVSVEIIANSFRFAKVHHSAVAAVALKDSIRMIQSDSNEGGNSIKKNQAADRSCFRLIQTPQTFPVALIKKAYSIEDDPSLTDDASVVERTGQSIFLFEGSYENLKITTAEDLVIAEALLNQRKLLQRE